MGTWVVGALAFVAMILVVVGIHELGHFAVAKWGGIRVDEFAIGFGPRLFSRRRGETLYSIRALPLGGYVRMPGMSALEDDDGGPRGFLHARLWLQVAVLLAGVTMNLLLAGVISGVLRTQGVDAAVSPNGGAARAGLADGDEITAIAGARLDTSNLDAVISSLHAATDGSRGRPIPVTYRTPSGETHTVRVVPMLLLQNGDHSQTLHDAAGDVVGALVVEAVNGHPATSGDPASLLGTGDEVVIDGHVNGADPAAAATRVHATVHGVVDGQDARLGSVVAAWKLGYGPANPGEALPRALVSGIVGLPAEVGGTVRSIWDVFTTRNSGGVSNFQGPVGIARDASAAAQAGWLDYLGLVGLISLSLGIVNVLPIPPFDGGRVVLSVRTALLGSRGGGARLEMILVGAGALLIGTLAVVITINDIKGF